MAKVKVKSLRQQLTAEFVFPAISLDIEAALAAQLDGDVYLLAELQRAPTGASQSPLHPVLSLEYEPDRSHVLRRGLLAAPWNDDPGAPVFVGTVTAVPMGAIDSGPMLRAAIRLVLTKVLEAIGAKARLGSSWRVEMEFDASAAELTARAMLPDDQTETWTAKVPSSEDEPIELGAAAAA